MFKSLFLPLIAVAVFITLVGLLSQGKFDSLLNKAKPSISSNYKSIKIEAVEVKVEVAKTNEERARGLSNRTTLESNSGMIFVFNNSKPVFWMKDTKISLDLIWINDNKIIKIDKNVQPELQKSDSELKKYPAPSAIDYVLEVNGGFSDNSNIKVGQNLFGLEQL